jgi:G3E family GTPase
MQTCWLRSLQQQVSSVSATSIASFSLSEVRNANADAHYLLHFLCCADPGSSSSSSSRSSSAAAGKQLPLQVAMQRQLLSADVILINKIDLITEQQKVSITAAVAALNPLAGRFQFIIHSVNIRSVS